MSTDGKTDHTIEREDMEGEGGSGADGDDEE